jgi:hypothetical protein
MEFLRDRNAWALTGTLLQGLKPSTEGPFMSDLKGPTLTTQQKKERTG